MSKLADIQDSLITAIKNNQPINQFHVKYLESNLQMAFFKRLAPNNLLVRNLLILDIVCKNPKNKDYIHDLMSLLSYGGEVWAEGYSYWKYCEEILQIYIDKFQEQKLQDLMDAINNGFMTTSYIRGNLLYPAPYGDLRDEPLKQELQINLQNSVFTEHIKLTRANGNYFYSFIAEPINLNNHVPKENYSVDVVNGQPLNFKFYTGYKSKYSSKMEEILDTFSFSRIKSLF